MISQGRTRNVFLMKMDALHRLRTTLTACLNCRQLQYQIRCLNHCQLPHQIRHATTRYHELMKISSQDLDTFFTILVQLIHNFFIFIFENMTCKEKKESTAKEPENRNLHNRRGVLEVNIMKNSFVKKLGLTAASAAVFGLVSSGVVLGSIHLRERSL